MTDVSPEPQGDEPTPEGVEPDEAREEETTDDGDPRLTKVRQEAKNLRSRLRDTEAERDGLRASLTAYNHADATVLASDFLTDGEDLFRGGVELADLLNADGTVDEDLVEKAARRVAKEHPHWTPNRAVTALQPGTGPSESAANWQKVLQG